jgi:hypothetical protein
MKDIQTYIDLAGRLLLDELVAWMDGGSVTLKLIDSNGKGFNVEFCQTMHLQKYPFTNTPGSFLYNDQEVPIRSDSENILLKALRNVRFKETIPVEEQITIKAWIQQLIDFVESEDYLRIAAIMGRLPG